MLIKAMKITEQDIFDDFWDQNIFGGVEYIDVKVKRVVEAIFIAGSLLDNVLMFAECFFLQSSWRYTNMINPIFHENIKKLTVLKVHQKVTCTTYQVNHYKYGRLGTNHGLKNKVSLALVSLRLSEKHKNKFWITNSYVSYVTVRIQLILKKS